MLMSFCTTSSWNLRPMSRLTANNVFCGLVTAWRLADWPTSTSSSLVNATMDGVVRSPSLFSMTRGLPLSMMATQELVVPRSMPMTLPISNSPKFFVQTWPLCGGPVVSFKKISALGRRHDDARRPQQSPVEQIPALHDGKHRIRRGVRGLRHHGFVLLRIERRAFRVQFLDLRLLEGLRDQPQCRLLSFDEACGVRARLFR